MKGKIKLWKHLNIDCWRRFNIIDPVKGNKYPIKASDLDYNGISVNYWRGAGGGDMNEATEVEGKKEYTLWFVKHTQAKMRFDYGRYKT